MPWLGSFGWLSSARSADVTWYLAGGVAAANCLAAFKPKGAADYAASKVNLVTPGTNDAADGAAFPTWAADTGWTFAAASTQYLVVGSGALVADYPLSMVCRFNSDNVTAEYALMGVNSTVGISGALLTLEGNVGGDPIAAYSVNGGGYDPANTSSGYTASALYTAAGVWASNTSRSSFIDGGSKGSSATSKAVSLLNINTIGVHHNASGLVLYFSGKIAACAFYNIALSDAQVLALHTAMAAL